MRRIKILLLSLLLAFCMAGCSEGSSVAISGSGDETAGKISQNGLVWRYILLMWDRGTLP